MVGPDTELADSLSEQPSNPQGRAGSGRADLGGLARRGMVSLGGAAISAIASFLLIVVVTRTFGKETAGFLFSTTSLFVMAEALCALGTATGMVYFIARHRALGNSGAVRSIIAMALPVVVVTSVVVAVALFFASPLIAAQMNGGDPAAEAVRFLRVLAAFLPLAVAYDVCIAASQGFHTMNPTVVLEKVSRPVLQLLGLSVAGLLGAAWLLPLAWAGPYLIGAIAAAVWLRRLVRSDVGRDQHHPAGPTRRAFWSYTAPRGLASAAQLTLQRLDVVLVALMLGAAPAALYTAATRFVVVGQLGSQAVALAVQPKYAELLAHDDRAATKRVYRTTTAWVMAVTWPIHLFVAVSAPVILKVFGPGYDSAWAVTVILALAMLFATSCGMVTMLLVMAGKTSWNLINVVVALVVNVVLNLTLIPVWGITGAAAAWAVALVISNALPLIQVRRLLGIDPFGRGSPIVAALAAVCFAVVPGSVWLLGADLWALVGLATVGTFLYALGIWRLRAVLDLDEFVTALKGRRMRKHASPSGRADYPDGHE